MADSNFISLRSVRVHNLQGIDVDIPLGKMTVVTGVSGAGKSSLVFDTLYAEAQRRYLQSFSPYVRQFLERFDKPEAESISALPPAVAIRGRTWPPSARATVGTLTEILDYLALLYARRGATVCRQCGAIVNAQQPADVLAFFEAQPAETRLSVAFPSRPEESENAEAWAAGLREEGFVRVQIGGTILRLGEQETPALSAGASAWVIVDRLEVGKTARERVTDSIETAFSRGHGRLALLIDQSEIVFDRRLLCPRCDILYPAPETRLFHFTDPLGACPTCRGTGTTPKSHEMCHSCHGSRYGDAALSVRLYGMSIAETCQKKVSELTPFLEPLASEESLLVNEIRKRLDCLSAVALGYLSLDRAASTLSTGEARRIGLTTALASNLAQALYLFEEPTAGLHASELAVVLEQLHRLRDAGNTVVVIDHNPETARAADYVIDLGPGAGEDGGQVLYQGPRLPSQDTPANPWPGKRRPLTHGRLRLSGANVHNLHNLTVEFPLGMLCVVTGVSGAGKSSLVEETLYPALCAAKVKKTSITTQAEVVGAAHISDVVLVDQKPLARTARSNPATYLKLFDDIRDLFADTSEARIRNFSAGAFSFNQPGGRCETCEGQGTLTVDMRFLADVTMICPDCHGDRFKPEILAVKVRSLSIAEVLDLTVRQAFRFFRAQRNIEKRLKTLLDVGLDYLRLGQSIDTLSGGEGQRLKLAGHLTSSHKPRTLFILVEPSIGLHSADVEQLLACFQRLLETGHSLIVVENNLDIIKCADHIIDLGPGAGPAGGRVVAAGTPEEVAQVKDSLTGQCLQHVLTIKNREGPGNDRE